MSKKKMPRRDFVKTAAAGVAGMAAASIPAASYARILGANDRVRVGIVGFSDRFRQALLPAFKAAGPALNFEIVAVSDIWNRRRDEGVAEIERVMGAKPRAFRNNEEMYAAKATDAVMISTPDFLHAHHGVEAIGAGMDAYIEKPMAHSMDQAVATHLPRLRLNTGLPAGGQGGGGAGARQGRHDRRARGRRHGRGGGDARRGERAGPGRADRPPPRPRHRLPAGDQVHPGGKVR